MNELILPGDTVWDVSANVGLYTQAFSQRVGDKGVVVAFEPSPLNYGRLDSAVVGIANIRLMNVGLAERDGTVAFSQGADSLGATSRIGESGAGATVVQIRRADSLVAQKEVASPSVVKIDVEGYEQEVLKGMSDTLASPALRAVGIEVHFAILASRRIHSAPREIEQMLRGRGFSVRWTDSSHIIATRDR